MVLFAVVGMVGFGMDARNHLECSRGVTSSTSRLLKGSLYEDIPESLYWIDEHTDEEWVPVLKHADIVAVKPIAGEVPGLAEKWLVVLEGNYQAMVKRVRTWSPVQREWQQPAVSHNLPQQFRPKRADRGTQGYNEVVGYYLDRVLGIYRVPPIVGRKLSSKLLFSYALEEDVVASKMDRFAWIKHQMPEQEIPVSMHAWMEGLHLSAPGLNIQDYLLHSKIYDNLHIRDRMRAAEVSDTLVFDYLLDDHDRNREHNWLADSTFTLLAWDNGLSFNHGPMARDSCLNLLCGPDKWTEAAIAQKKRCEKICRFRKTLIDSLREFDSSANTLGIRLEEAIKEDALEPLEYNVFYIFGRWPKVTFPQEDFFLGIDMRVRKLLAHVDRCYDSFGEDIFIDVESFI